jgi:hypothetical protein
MILIKLYYNIGNLNFNNVNVKYGLTFEVHL